MKEPWEILAGAVLVIINYENDGRQFSDEDKLLFITRICEHFVPPKEAHECMNMNEPLSNPSPNECSVIPFPSAPKHGGPNSLSPVPSRKPRSRQPSNGSPARGVLYGVVLSAPLWWLILSAIRWLARN